MEYASAAQNFSLHVHTTCIKRNYNKHVFPNF